MAPCVGVECAHANQHACGAHPDSEHAFYDLCISLRRTNHDDPPMLQQCNLCISLPTTRRGIHLDPRNEDLSVRTTPSHRPVAARARKLPVLLCGVHLPSYRLARDQYRHDGVEPVEKERLRALFLWSRRPQRCRASLRDREDGHILRQNMIRAVLISSTFRQFFSNPPTQCPLPVPFRLPLLLSTCSADPGITA